MREYKHLKTIQLVLEDSISQYQLSLEENKENPVVVEVFQERLKEQVNALAYVVLKINKLKLQP